MDTNKQDGLLNMLKAVILGFRKAGSGAILSYSDGCITAKIYTKVCTRCRHIHDDSVVHARQGD